MTGPDIIRCEIYQCDMSEQACAQRYADAQRKRRLRLWHCAPCDAGRVRALECSPVMNTTREARLVFNPQWAKAPAS